MKGLDLSAELNVQLSAFAQTCTQTIVANQAVGETAILLHPTPPTEAGVSIGMEEGYRQNDSLADG